MNRFKIGTRLTWAFAFLLLLIAMLAAITLWRIEASDRADAQLAKIQEDERLIAEWDKIISVNTTRTVAAIRSMDPDNMRYFQAGIDATSQRGEEIQSALRERLSEPEAIGLFQAALRHRDIYRDARAAALQAQREGDLMAGERFFQERMEPLIQAYTQKVSDLLSHQQSLMAETRQGLASEHELARTLALTLAIAITRSITRPLNRAVSLAETVAARDLTANIAVSGRDETSALLHALRRMNDNLAGVVGEVRQGANELAGASEQMLADNRELSSRTEQQAASLMQTASAMEELTATVRRNADNAQQANTLVATAVQVASRGGEVVREVVATMDSINDSSKKVEDIIGVIDSIAFQTNILALNAAVESARAGEAGRGFAVVASEVRALAQRSANAAHEIKGLITASVSAAATGHRLVNETGTTMTEILDAIQQVTDIIGEISAASQEQSLGINEINDAVLQMDTATRENASLVAETAAATARLREQASRLSGLVATFRVTEAAAIVEIPPQSVPLAPKPAKAKAATPAKLAIQAAPALAIGAFQTSAGPVEEWEEF